MSHIGGCDAYFEWLGAAAERWKSHMRLQSWRLLTSGIYYSFPRILRQCRWNYLFCPCSNSVGWNNVCSPTGEEERKQKGNGRENKYNNKTCVHVCVCTYTHIHPYIEIHIFILNLFKSPLVMRYFFCNWKLAE